MGVQTNLSVIKSKIIDTNTFFCISKHKQPRIDLIFKEFYYFLVIFCYVVVILFFNLYTVYWTIEKTSTQKVWSKDQVYKKNLFFIESYTDIISYWVVHWYYFLLSLNL